MQSRSYDRGLRWDEPLVNRNRSLFKWQQEGHQRRQAKWKKNQCHYYCNIMQCFLRQVICADFGRLWRSSHIQSSWHTNRNAIHERSRFITDPIARLPWNSVLDLNVESFKNRMTRMIDKYNLDIKRSNNLAESRSVFAKHPMQSLW